jgi:hypothetical protein
MAKTRYRPSDPALVQKLEGRAEALAGTFNAQGVANTLWAYATMGREPGAGVMRGLEGRAEALAGTFNAQDVANTLWAYCVFFLLRAFDAEFRWVDTVVQRLVSLDKPACFNSAQLCQLHQFFLTCSVEPRLVVDARLVVEAIKDIQSLKDTCRLAFEGAQTTPSATQQQVSETLRQMGLSVEDEVRCPKSGYSIDMLVHDSALEIGGERSSTGGLWAMEFDGPWHFLASGAPTGATLLKRRHLHVLGHTLVSVPYWEWAGCKGTGEREQYLRGKLRQCTLEAGKDSALAFQHHFGQPMSSNVKSDVTAPWQALACAAVSRSDIKVSHASRASPRPCTRSDGAADGCGGAAGGGGCAAGGGMSVVGRGRGRGARNQSYGRPFGGAGFGAGGRGGSVRAPPLRAGEREPAALPLSSIRYVNSVDASRVRSCVLKDACCRAEAPR